MEEWLLLQQPEKLKDLATDKLAVWIGVQADNMKSTIAELHKCDPTKAETVLSQQIEVIRDRIESNVPRMLHDMLLNQTIDEMYRLTLKISNSKTEIDEIEAALIIYERMVETLFTKNVTFLSLSFEKFNMVRKSLSSKSHLLTGLVTLDLNANQPDYEIHYTFDIENEIIQMLEKLHSLKCLKLLNLKSDRIVRCIVKNCVLIEELVIDTNYPMNDDTIKLLPQLVNLRGISLGTLVNTSGYEILLLHCKNIEHITCLSYPERSRLSEALKRVVCKSNAGTFNLKSYSLYHNTTEELRVIFRTCPLIQHLIVKETDTAINANVIRTITDLKNLRELTLHGFSVYAATVSVLNVVGRNLEHLCYTGGYDIDMNAMIDISQMCPNLKNFCVIQRASPGRVHDMQGNKKTKLEISPFKSLKKLTVSYPSSLTAQEQESAHESIFFLLSNCSNLEFLELRMPHWFTEDAMLRILDKNPLIHLKQLKIWYTPGSPLTRRATYRSMSTLFIERLIKNCINPLIVIQIQ